MHKVRFLNGLFQVFRLEMDSLGLIKVAKGQQAVFNKGRNLRIVVFFTAKILFALFIHVFALFVPLPLLSVPLLTRFDGLHPVHLLVL
jgi:hypothetical protein